LVCFFDVQDAIHFDLFYIEQHAALNCGLRFISSCQVLTKPDIYKLGVPTQNAHDTKTCVMRICVVVLVTVGAIMLILMSDQCDSLGWSCHNGILQICATEKPP